MKALLIGSDNVKGKCVGGFLSPRGMVVKICVQRADDAHNRRCQKINGRSVMRMCSALAPPMDVPFPKNRAAQI